MNKNKKGEFFSPSEAAAWRKKRGYGKDLKKENNTKNKSNDESKLFFVDFNCEAISVKDIFLANGVIKAATPFTLKYAYLSNKKGKEGIFIGILINNDIQEVGFEILENSKIESAEDVDGFVSSFCAFKLPPINLPSYFFD